MPRTPDDWTRKEVEACVAEYLDMLLLELRGTTFNKAARNRHLQRLLPRRDRGAFEYKHRNISAILVELGLPYVRGYKPSFNYQELLRIVIEERLRGDMPLFSAAEEAVERPVVTIPAVRDILSIVIPPPFRKDGTKKLQTAPQIGRKAVRRNYLQVEARNRSLGLAGEEFVLRYEHERLWRANRKKLAERIEHVSQSQGDYLGFDIASFEIDGRERLIEVKTTQFGALTPFFASRNEVDVSESLKAKYHLYRLFNFVRSPKMFTLEGALGCSCDLTPVQFSAILKSSN